MVLLSLTLERRISPFVNGLQGESTPAETRPAVS
jgi:hypothetical protein